MLKRRTQAVALRPRTLLRLLSHGSVAAPPLPLLTAQPLPHQPVKPARKSASRCAPLSHPSSSSSPWLLAVHPLPHQPEGPRSQICVSLRLIPTTLPCFHPVTAGSTSGSSLTRRPTPKSLPACSPAHGRTVSWPRSERSWERPALRRLCSLGQPCSLGRTAAAADARNLLYCCRRAAPLACPVLFLYCAPCPSQLPASRSDAFGFPALDWCLLLLPSSDLSLSACINVHLRNVTM